jgi:PAS domain S-box-containing protein
MLAASSLTLGMVHLFVWFRDRNATANLLFAISAIAASVLAIQEMAVMRAQTPAEYLAIMRWMYLPITIIIVSIVWFIRSYLSAGRLWLAWSITGLRVLVLILSFLLFPNVTFQEVIALREVLFLGETLSAPVGEASTWRVLIHLSMILWIIYVLDAANTARKRGKARQAIVLGGGVLSAIILAMVFSDLMVRGILPGPLSALVFQVIVFAMAFELSVDLIRSRQLSRELEDREERMQLAARAAALGFWDWDIAQDKVWMSTVGWPQTGNHKADRMNMQGYLDLLHPDDRERIRDSIFHTLEHDDEFHAEFRIVNPNGNIRWLLAHGQVEYDGYGKPKRMLGVSYDISDRKNAEADLQERRRDLAHISRVATLGQLSSAMAHEINQPLGAILRNTEAAELLLRKTPPDIEELRDILADIRKDEQRAAAVIDSMRSFLKRRELDFEPLEVTLLIDQVAQLVRTELQLHSTSLHIEVPHGLPRVQGDRIHLQQVIMNLLLNSLDALDESLNKERKIIIQAQQFDENMVEIKVIDNGKGLAQQDIQYLFEPFFTTKPQGTGIGLAITKTIVESHGGLITAQENPEGGAIFSFTLKGVQE